MTFKIKFSVSYLTIIVLIISCMAQLKGNIIPDPYATPSYTPIATLTDTIPLIDRQGDFINDKQYNPFDILPSDVEQSVEYDPSTDSYIVYERIGDEYFRSPTTMTFQEYIDWKSAQQDRKYLDKLVGIEDTYKSASGRVDPMSKVNIEKNLVDRLFGGNGITITPQGSIDLNFGSSFTETEDNTLQQNQRRQFNVLDFDMDIKMNVDGKIGDKMDLGFNYDTNASFDFDRKIKLAYDSEKWTEDDILKKIEAGNVSLPLRSSLIQGAQELFGIKTELQFGHLTLTAVASQQRSEQENLQIQNGATVQEFELRPQDYDENRHFFLSHYHRNAYEESLTNMPYIDNSFRVTNIEVWISDDRANFQSDQTMITALADLAEPNPDKFTSSSSTLALENDPMIVNITTDKKDRRLPDNRVNTLYEEVVKDELINRIEFTNTILKDKYNLEIGRDFETFRGRKLNPSEYFYNAELGFISLNIKLRPNQVLGVAYEYFYTNNCEDVYKVGVTTDEGSVPNADSLGVVQSEGVIFTKLLKNSTQNVLDPAWDLMMKNVYPLRVNNLDQSNFEFDIYYENDLDGTLRKTLDEKGFEFQPLLNIFGLDKLNSRNDPQPDGIFDFVPGITVVEQTGSIIFPVLEPFGDALSDAIEQYSGLAGTELENLKRKYVYNELYDTSVTIAALKLEQNKFVMAGKIESSVTSEYSLGAWNIPQGSVRVTAGSVQLIENVHYEVDYGIGRLRILDQSIIQQGVPVNISFEDNSVFNLQQKNLLGLRAEYEFSENFYLGGTLLKLQERPFTQKVNLGDDPINNRIYGLDMAYSKESTWLTKAVDKLPFYSTNAPSSINFTAEVAALKPGHNKAINSNSPEDEGGVVSLDDFEGAVSGFPLSSQPNRWTLASIPRIPRFEETLIPDSLTGLKLGANRAKLSWYVIDRFVDIPDGVKNENSFTRRINQTELFNRQLPQGQLPDLLTFDLTYHPTERGPYNFDLPEGYLDHNGNRISAGIEREGDEIVLKNPEERWAGIMRYLSNNDFEANNYEFIEFWLLNPYGDKPDGEPHDADETGYLTFHLGNVSEDILPDNQQFYENSLPRDNETVPITETEWGNVPKNSPINDAFQGADFTAQDLGLDGLNDAEETGKFQEWLSEVDAAIVLPNTVREDPAGDNYVFFNDPVYAGENNLVERYKNNNNPENNSPNVSQQNTFQRGNPIPDKEDLNNNRSLDQRESFYEYKIEIKKDPTAAGLDEDSDSYKRYVTDKRQALNRTDETWYRFRIPLNTGTSMNGIQGFRSIQFIRMLVEEFTTTKTFRMAEFELVRNQWRRQPTICTDDGGIVDVDFTIDVVGVEENSSKEPFGYELPPGIIQERLISSYAQVNQDENALVMNFNGLPGSSGGQEDVCVASIVKLTDIDLRTFKRMQMFVHGEPGDLVNSDDLQTGDLSVFIRLGKDFVNHYYEYEIPLTLSDGAIGRNEAEVVWPAANKFNFALDMLIQAKKIRNVLGVPNNEVFTIDNLDDHRGLEAQYESIDFDTLGLPLGHKIRVVGNPNLGLIKGVNIGVRNNDDSPHNGQVWINELRLVGLQERGGVAGLARMDMQLADLGTVSASASYSSIGWGALDQKVAERALEEQIDYDIATNLEMGKFFPDNWGLKVPVYAQYARAITNPEFDAYDFDITVEDEYDLGIVDDEEINNRNAIVNTIRTFNLTNVRKEKGGGNKKPKRPSRTATKSTPGQTPEPKEKKERKPMPWNIENFSASYAYTDIEYRDPILKADNSTNQTLGLDYNFSRRGGYIQPFKKVKSKYLKIVKEFNFNPIPTSFAFNSTINRFFATRTYRLPETPAFEFDDRRFDWERRYDLGWNLTKALKMNFSAFNESYIDEARQVGIAATPEDRPWIAFVDDGTGTLSAQDVTAEVQNDPAYPKNLWKNNLRSGGRNTHYDHSLSVNYTVPIKYLPFLDWVDVKGQYRSTFSWDAGALIKDAEGQPLAGVVQNSQNRSVTANLNFDKLYKKSDYLKNLDKPKSKRGSRSSKDKDKGKDKVSVSKKDGKRVERKKKRIPGIAEKLFLRPLFMLRSARLTYKEDFVSVIPGYTESPDFFGMSSWNAPGRGFVFGLQPDISRSNPNNYLVMASNQGWITDSPAQNQEIVQTRSQNIDAKFKIEPWKDFKIDVDFKKSYRSTHSEVYKFIDKDTIQDFARLAARDMGSFDFTYYNLNTLFGRSKDELFSVFENNRIIISDRLDETGLPHQDYNSYKQGYGPTSSAVAVPAFLAAYTNRDPVDVALDLESEVQKIGFIPKPNWKLRYDGLSKLPWFKDKFSSFTLEHGYSSNLRVSSFNTDVQYDGEDPFAITRLNGNYYTRIEIPAIQISENFNPVIGLKMKTKNDFTMEFQYVKSRDLNLKINTSNQLEEDRKESFVFGMGYTIKDSKFLQKKKRGRARSSRDKKDDDTDKPGKSGRDRTVTSSRGSDMTFMLNLAYNDNGFFVHETDGGTNVEDAETRGSRGFQINPTVDYILNKNVTLRAFFDYNENTPYGARPFKRTNVAGGITVRMTLN